MSEHWTKRFTKEELRELRREDRAADRAFALLDSPAGRQFFNALDTVGWKVVLQRPLFPGEPEARWPVPIGTRAKWPAWCNHEFSAAEIAKEKRAAKRPKLRLVEKHPDDGDAHD